MITTPGENVSGFSNLLDAEGRRIRKLRVSLTDACNFRCFYCMPEHVSFTDQKKFLSVGEIEAICRSLVKYGISEIRLTGGEPTLRSEFKDIVARLGTLPLSKFGLTTNGFKLSECLHFLKDHNLRHINVSLDSLQEERFFRITRRKAFDAVMSAILEAKDLDFRLKLNVVLMRGVNDDEILDFVGFAAAHDIEVRFLEVMRIGQMARDLEKLVSASEILSVIASSFSYTPVQVEDDATAKVFQISNGAKIGIIASETQPFCGSCSRWRLTAEGHLRACLMSEKGRMLKGLHPSEYPPVLEDVLSMKPTGRITYVEQNMNEIGG